jgi:hypothetical protein
LEVSTAVPPGTIQDQHDLFVCSCSYLLGKSRQGEGEDLNADPGQQQPAGLSALRMHKRQDVHPFIALSDWGFHPRSLWRPDPSQNGLETNAMLIHGPEFNASLGMLVMHQSHLLRAFF